MNLSASERIEIERELSDALREVALEIRCVDALDLASDMHRMAFGNLGDIVHSACELHFRPEALMFAYTGDVSLTWFGAPKVGFDMELHAEGVDAHFRLTVDGLSADARLQHIAVDGALWREGLDFRRLRAAIASARVTAPCGPRANHQPRTSFGA
jgi:hypothetical protein